MANTFLNKAAQLGLIARYLAQRVLHQKHKAPLTEEGPQLSGYFRSSGYICPSVYFNHKSGSFSRNRRAELKRRRV